MSDSSRRLNLLVDSAVIGNVDGRVVHLCAIYVCVKGGGGSVSLLLTVIIKFLLHVFVLSH